MTTRRATEGRYLVGEKAAPCLGAAIAYAGSLAAKEQRTVYVRIIGERQAVARAEYHEHDRSVSITST